MKRTWRVVGVVSVLILLLAATSGLRASEPSAPPPASPAPAAGRAAIPAGVSTEGPVFHPVPASRAVSLSAFTRPRSVMSLVSEESGPCLEVMADVGQAVRPDGVFARLDDAFLRLNLEKNRAEQKRLQADVEFYAQEVRRYETLVGRDSAAQRDLDNDRRILAGSRMGLESLKVEEKTLEEHLRRSTLRAPVGWKVMERRLEPGEYVRAGDKVAELGRFDMLLVPFSLTVGELAALQAKGGVVELAMPDFGNKARARIERIAPDFDPQTRKINVDLVLESDGFEFRGGLRADLLLELADEAGAFLAPATALVKAYEEQFLVRPGGERLKVTFLGPGPEGFVRVSGKGLSPDQVFLENPEGS